MITMQASIELRDSPLVRRRLFDSPSWCVVFAAAQEATKRFKRSDLNRLGLPQPHLVLHEVIRVSTTTLTGEVVQILALTILDRVLLGRPAAGLVAYPGVRLSGLNWATVWIFCVHLAAKIHFDARCKISDLSRDGLMGDLVLDDLGLLETLLVRDALQYHVSQHEDEYNAALARVTSFERAIPPAASFRTRTRGPEDSLGGDEQDSERIAIAQLRALLNSEAYAGRVASIGRERRAQVSRYVAMNRSTHSEASQQTVPNMPPTGSYPQSITPPPPGPHVNAGGGAADEARSLSQPTPREPSFLFAAAARQLTRPRPQRPVTPRNEGISEPPSPADIAIGDLPPLHIGSRSSDPVRRERQLRSLADMTPRATFTQASGSAHPPFQRRPGRSISNMLGFGRMLGSVF